MKLVLKTTALSLALLLIITPWIRVGAASQLVADPNDYFQVFSPGPESRITGGANVVWQVTDSDTSSIPFQLNLKDVGSCTVVQRQLASGTAASSSNQISTGWNSAAVADGAYCMELCVNLHKGTDPYLTCNARTIYVRNTNHAPQIVTTPPNGNIQTTQGWTYDVNAVDADGDALSYSLAAAPGFVSINSVNGVVSVSAAAKTPGSYNITVQVRDSMGAIAQQSFVITVVAAAPATPTQPVPSAETSVKIISPTESSKFSGDKNVISWQITNPGAVSGISIYYSTDKATWTKIADLAKTTSDYSWNVSQIDAGEYQVKVVAQLPNAGETSAVSPTFAINQTPNQHTTVPVIYDILPSDNAEIRDSNPIISGKFLPSIGHEILPKTFSLKIDNEDKTDLCEVSHTGFKCQIATKLNAGEHTLHVQIDDTSTQTASHDWKINITSTTSPDTGNTSDTVNLLGQTIAYRSLIWVIIICCALLFLLLIPWLLYRLWKNRDREDDNEFNNWQYPDEAVPASPTQPNVEVNYIYPESVESNPEVVDLTSRELSELGITPTVQQTTNEPTWLTPETTSVPNNLTVNVGVPEQKQVETGSFGYASKLDE